MGSFSKNILNEILVVSLVYMPVSADSSFMLVLNLIPFMAIASMCPKLGTTSSRLTPGPLVILQVAFRD